MKKRISVLILTNDLSNVNFVNMHFELLLNVESTKMCILGQNHMLVKRVVPGTHSALRYEVMLAGVTDETVRK